MINSAIPCFDLGAQKHPPSLFSFFEIRLGNNLFLPNSSPSRALTKPLFLTLRGKFNSINVINKRYQRNLKRHRDNFLLNIFLAPA